MKTIDFEFHCYIKEALEVMSKDRGTYPRYFKDSNMIMWSDKVCDEQDILDRLYMREEERVAYMDRCGIDIAVLSSAPGVDELGEDSIDLCRKINDDTYMHIKKYPGRFLGSAMLPMHDMDAACDELKRCVNEMGFVAWHAHTNVMGRWIEDEFFRPLFKCAEDLGIYVYLHPRCSINDRFTGFGFNLPGSGLGFTHDAQIAIIKMMISGLFDQMPNLTIMLGHLAEGLPFYFERLENRLHLRPVDTIVLEKEVSYYFKHNIMTSTSGNTSKEAFLLTKELMGIDQITIGTDTPFENGKVMMDFLDNIPLTVEEREKLYYKNAEKLLKCHL